MYKIFVSSVRLVKLACNWLPMGPHQHQIDISSPMCPICDEYIETTSHLFCCKEEGSKEKREELIKDFRDKMKKTKPAPIIMNAILEGIQQYTEEQEISERNWSNDNIGKMTEKAMNQQTEIGWYHLMKGRITKQWGRTQAEYYRERYPGKTYLNEKNLNKQLIRSLWRLFDGIWENRNDKLHQDDGAYHQ